jgi:CheY-like chemotaxis protein
MATILCVEDEGHIREEIAESMESTGHKVLQACDGKVALEMIL